MGSRFDCTICTNILPSNGYQKIKKCLLILRFKDGYLVRFNFCSLVLSNFLPLRSCGIWWCLNGFVLTKLMRFQQIAYCALTVLCIGYTILEFQWWTCLYFNLNKEPTNQLFLDFTYKEVDVLSLLFALSHDFVINISCLINVFAILNYNIYTFFLSISDYSIY